MKRRTILERNDRMSLAMKSAYSKIREGISQYAAEKGIKAVYTLKVSLDDFDAAHPDDWLQWGTLVNVFWHDDRLDISDAIITIINGS